MSKFSLRTPARSLSLVSPQIIPSENEIKTEILYTSCIMQKKEKCEVIRWDQEVWSCE